MRKAKIIATLLTVAVHGCGPSPSERLVGWPDAKPDPTEAPSVPDAVVTDTMVAAPLTAADTGTGDVDPLRDLPCKVLAELACSYFGPHTDECSLARTERPDDGDPTTRTACGVLVERYTTIEETARLNPCRRYSRLVCKLEGVDTRICQTSRRNLPLLRRHEEKRACLGDMLMYEARDLRR